MKTNHQKGATMSRPLRIEYPGAFYHVTSRGNERKDIFKSNRDREKFLEYLESTSERYGGVIHCYCLMGTHYHLLLETPKANLSQIMRHINGAYTTYFNIKRNRAGHLFQGRYKAILVEADSYAVELSRYIHLNPVRAGMVSRPEQYVWSSYRSYIGTQGAPGWLRSNFILGYFGKEAVVWQKGYAAFVEDLLDSEYESPLVNTVASIILGRPEFVEDVIETYIDGRKADDNLPELRHLAHRPKYEEIIKAVSAHLAGQPELVRTVSMHCCKKYSGAQLKDIGEYFGKSGAAISQASRRLRVKSEKDEALKRVISCVERSFKKSH